MSSRTYQFSMLKVPVSDIQNSVQFCEMKLGFHLEFMAPEYGWAQMQAGKIPIALYKPGMGRGKRQMGGSVDFHLSLAGNEFDELAKLIQAEGPLVEDRVHQGNDETTFIEIYDPDRNELKVFKSG